MDVHVFLIQIVLILLAARLFGEIAAFFKVPSVIGELVAGVIIGPSLLGLVTISSPIQLLAQIGVILLLFEVGIETDVGKLTSSGLKASVVAFSGVVFPFAFGFCVSFYVFGMSLLVSLFVGCTLIATSIGVTLRVLRDFKKQNSQEAPIIIGAAVLDDILGIVILSILYEFSVSGHLNLWNAGKVLFFIVLFLLVAPIFAKIVSQTIKKWDEKSDIPGLLPTMIVMIILFFSWIAHQLGAPELLGGLSAGLALSRQFFLPFASFLRQSLEFSQRVESEMKPIIHLFTPIFFVAIGLSLNLRVVNWGHPRIWYLTCFLLVVAIIGKMLSGFFLSKTKMRSKLIIGTAMVPRGEVGLIFANLGLTVGVLENDIYAAVILVIALTTAVPPFILRYLYSRDVSDSHIKI